MTLVPKVIKILQICKIPGNLQSVFMVVNSLPIDILRTVYWMYFKPQSKLSLVCMLQNHKQKQVSESGRKLQLW